MIKHWNVFDDGYDLRRQLPGEKFEFDANLLLVIHAYTIDRDTMKAVKRTGKPLDEELFNLDVASALKRIMMQRLNEYNTSIAEDIVLLRDSALRGRRRMAIEVRLGEKEILATALDCVGKRIEALNQEILLHQEYSKVKTTSKKRRV